MRVAGWVGRARKRGCVSGRIVDGMKGVWKTRIEEGG